MKHYLSVSPSALGASHPTEHPPGKSSGGLVSHVSSHLLVGVLLLSVLQKIGTVQKRKWRSIAEHFGVPVEMAPYLKPGATGNLGYYVGKVELLHEVRLVDHCLWTMGLAELTAVRPTADEQRTKVLLKHPPITTLRVVNTLEVLSPDRSDRDKKWLIELSTDAGGFLNEAYTRSVIESAGIPETLTVYCADTDRCDVYTKATTDAPEPLPAVPDLNDPAAELKEENKASGPSVGVAVGFPAGMRVQSNRPTSFGLPVLSAYQGKTLKAAPGSPAVWTADKSQTGSVVVSGVVEGGDPYGTTVIGAPDLPHYSSDSAAVTIGGHNWACDVSRQLATKELTEEAVRALVKEALGLQNTGKPPGAT